MEDLYLKLAFLTAGVSLSMGSISLFIGLKRQHEADLIFGFMGLSLLIFLLLPPVGFIFSDQAPYSLDILVKRIFIYTYYALFPWFIRFYTGKGSFRIPILISIGVIADYVIMFQTIEDRAKPIWSMVAVIMFASIAVYGLISGISQYRGGEKFKAYWFILAVAIFGFLTLLTAINQFGENLIAKEIRMKLFFPIHFHSLLFMLIMGFRVVADVYEKYRLEKVLKARDKRWQSFMHHAPVFVLELDKTGNITYVNTFGLDLLGYSCVTNLLNKNWFDLFSVPSEIKSTKLLYETVIREEKMAPYFKNTICTKQGQEIVIEWANYLSYSDDGELLGVMSVGRDVTGGLSAQRVIDQLKLELEKENVRHLTSFTASEIIGSSKAIGYAIQKANQVAATNAPVLLEGETGVGKELFAELVHKRSSRNTVPMVKVNCGALPKDLIEDELFGHEKGAFTSAIQSRKGRFELAHGGTIFLDEIGELPLELQPKLLRVLQNGEFERVGGQATIKVDVRVIAATNRDLAHEVSEGRYRDDLFYRLNVFPITIPSIRKRKEDLPALINYFISRKSKKYNKTLDQISKADLQRLMDYSWPGNVRELKNVIERSVISSEGTTLKLDWFFGETGSAEHVSPETLEQIERNHILRTMENCHWKINGENGAAERLDMHPNTLRSKMKRLGIIRPHDKSSEPVIR